MICTKGVNKVNPGFGDRGAPLVWYSQSQNYLIGVFAFAGSPEDLFNNGLAGYLNVAYNIRWLINIVSSLEIPSS